MASLLERFLQGDRAALARLITRAEYREPEFLAAVDQLFARVGRAYRLGITGPPGAGKSTLVDGLAAGYRRRGDQVAILAVDPSSPYTGGALLGDRIRMRSAEEDTSVFVRSMATRGSLGGLARATIDAADLLDAFGFGRVLLETVGVGQAEHDIVSASDTVLVVLYPGGGDGVQAMKAGLMEIADVFVANKADQPGVDRLVDDIQQMLELRGARHGWVPPVVQVVASERRGIDELGAAIDRHRQFQEEKGLLAERRHGRRVEQVRRDLEEELRGLILEELGFGIWIDGEIRRQVAPATVAREALRRLKGQIGRF
ncbi:MAG: methylmalonyl Co-A mutase-associated GTPase MeaB [Planctomycetes bacterium]|nr:methylmalonyl Co-A mutase-associated GTPase MeaB [Planctomycetota bacterium]